MERSARRPRFNGAPDRNPGKNEKSKQWKTDKNVSMEPQIGIRGREVVPLADLGVLQGVSMEPQIGIRGRCQCRFTCSH